MCTTSCSKSHPSNLPPWSQSWDALPIGYLLGPMGQSNTQLIYPVALDRVPRQLGRSMVRLPWCCGGEHSWGTYATLYLVPVCHLPPLTTEAKTYTCLPSYAPPLRPAVDACVVMHPLRPAMPAPIHLFSRCPVLDRENTDLVRILW